VDALLVRDKLTYGVRMGALGNAASEAAAAVDSGDLHAFIGAATKTAAALEALGIDAKANIVPASYAELARVAEGESSAFLPSGAGGGDVAVYLGEQKPSEAFLGRAYLFGMRPLGIAIDRDGVRIADSPRAPNHV
jgi:phosphomevalonate kinase